MAKEKNKNSDKISENHAAEEMLDADKTLDAEATLAVEKETEAGNTEKTKEEISEEAEEISEKAEEISEEAEKVSEKAEEISEEAEEAAEKSVEEPSENSSEDKAGETEADTDTSEPLEDDKIPLDPETGLDPEQLRADLENLKDLVQGEIDKMMTANPDTEWKDIVKAAAEEKAAARSGKRANADVLCECCGERPANEDGIYCDECLETMKHYPFEWWKILIPVVAVVLVVLSCSFFAISWPVYKETVDAQKLVKEHKLSSALDAYDKINAEIKVTDENFGYKYLRNQVEIYDFMGVNAYEQLNTFIDKYYAGTIIDKKRNKYVKEVKSKVDSYTKSYEYYSKAVASSKDYETFVKTFDAAIKGKDINPAMAAYYKYYASVVYGEDLSVQRKNVEAIRTADARVKSLYLPLFAEVSLNEEKYDEVLKHANELATVNIEDPYVYIYRAVAYRLQGNINLASNACNQGLKISAADPLLNYQMSVVCLLQGKTNDAKTYAGTAYQYANTENLFVSSASLYALCSSLNNDAKTYNSILSDLSNYSYSLSPDVEKVISGEKKVEDIFMSGKGDFTWE